MARARVITSAAVILYVNGKPFGQVAEFSFRSTTPRRALYGLDSVDPYELAPTQAKITANMKLYRTVGDGGAEGAGLTAGFEDLSRERYFSILLVDRGASDAVIFQADLCSLSGQSWSVPSRGIITGSIEFEALTWNNDIKALGINFSG